LGYDRPTPEPSPMDMIHGARARLLFQIDRVLGLKNAFEGPDDAEVHDDD
jgi:hypothetical protein